MRRMTNYTAACLIAICSLTAIAQPAQASLFSTLTDILHYEYPPGYTPPQPPPIRLALNNNTGMTIEIERWTPQGEYLGKVRLAPGDEWHYKSRGWLDGSVEFDLFVLKPKRREWMYYDTLSPRTSFMIAEAVKWGKRDFGFRTILVAR